MQSETADSCSRRPVEKPMMSSCVMVRATNAQCAYHAGLFFFFLDVHGAHRTLDSLLEVCVTVIPVVSRLANVLKQPSMSYTSSCRTSAISATASSSSLVFFDLTAGSDSL